MKAFLKKAVKVDIGICQESDDSAILLLFLPKKVIPLRLESHEKLDETILAIEELKSE